MNSRIMFDYGKLRGRIIEVYGSQKKFSNAMHISQGTLTAKLAGTSYFTQGEILRAKALLGLEPDSISSYFFTPKV